MYMKMNRVVLRWTDTVITHIALHDDDGKFIKFLSHTKEVMVKWKETDVLVSDDFWFSLMKLHEIDKVQKKRARVSERSWK